MSLMSTRLEILSIAGQHGIFPLNILSSCMQTPVSQIGCMLDNVEKPHVQKGIQEPQHGLQVGMMLCMHD